MATCKHSIIGRCDNCNNRAEIVELQDALKEKRDECARLREVLNAFAEPMRRYIHHSAWLKGDEELLLAAERQRIAALAAQPNDDSVCLFHTDTPLEWLENDSRGTKICAREHEGKSQ